MFGGEIRVRTTMNPWRWVDPRIRSVRLDSVRRYLESRGWELKPGPNPAMLCFEAPGGDNGKESPVCVLPASERVSDFVQSLTYFITTISEVEERHPVAVLEDILQFQSTSAVPTAPSGR
jgi:hypothetical protein